MHLVKQTAWNFVWTQRIPDISAFSKELINIPVFFQLQVNSVREFCAGRSNNEIIMVLQFYDYDVEKTIQAFVEGEFLQK